MLLVFDIGNTNICVGGFDGSELRFEFRLKTDPMRTVDEYIGILDTLLARKLKSDERFQSAIICSVVPPVTLDVVRVCKEIVGIDPLVVGPGIKTGIAIHVNEPSAVGADRVVNAVAAKELMGSPALVVDFGTATTFDLVGVDGSYQGGVIAPGLSTALDSLVRNTAKLPRIEIAWPRSVIGKNTTTAMQSGAVIGYVCMVDGLIDEIIKETGPIQNILATGGLGGLIQEHSKRISGYDPILTLKGLRMIADLNK